MTQMSVTGTLSDLVTEAESSLTEPSVGQRDGAPAETDSDSGDSLFITQKPVPEAVRSGRRRRSSFRSDPPSLTDAEGSDDSASPEESKTDRKKTVKRIKLPKHSFSFLKQRRIGPIRIEELKIKQNTSLHSAVMGGFFKSVRDVWQSRQRKKKTSLPTVDMPKESILPISEEEEEEKPEDEDIRVVEKKRFVVSLKAKCSQSWCTSSQGDGQEKKQRGRRSMKARQETSQGGQQKMLAPKSRELLSTCTSSDEKEESSSRALVERKTSDKLVASNTSAAETPKTEKREENEDDSSASVCELSPNGPEASTEVAEPQEDVFLTDERPQTGQAECEPEGQNLLQTDANDDTMCSESRVKKKIEDRRGHEAVEEEEGQSQHDVSFTEVEETPSVSQTIAELVIHKIKAMESLSHDDNIITVEERDIPDPKKKKKKKKTQPGLGSSDDENSDRPPITLKLTTGHPSTQTQIDDGSDWSTLTAESGEDTPSWPVAMETEECEVVRCVCEVDEENDFMIQCESCLCWQHGTCMGLYEDNVPHNYICYYCRQTASWRRAQRVLSEPDVLISGHMFGLSCVKENYSEINASKISHTGRLLAHTHNLNQVLNGLQLKISLLHSQSHPDLHLWKLPWRPEEGTRLMSSPKGEPTVSYVSSEHCYQKPGASWEKAEDKDSPTVAVKQEHDTEEKEIQPEDINKTPADISADTNIVTHTDAHNDESMERENAAHPEGVEHAHTQMYTPEPRPASVAECQLNLLDHVESLHHQISARMDLIERELDVLESWLDHSGELEPPDPLSRLPQLKQRIRRLLCDLCIVRRLSVCR